jgi:hypothetical protein
MVIGCVRAIQIAPIAGGDVPTYPWRRDPIPDAAVAGAGWTSIEIAKAPRMKAGTFRQRIGGCARGTRPAQGIAKP